MNNLQITLNGKTHIIEVRDKDGYLNATQLCKAGGKVLNNYIQNTSSTEHHEYIEHDTGRPISELIEIKKGGTNQGTWVHKEILPHLLHWIHPSLKEQYIRQEQQPDIHLIMPDSKNKDLSGFIYIIHFKQETENPEKMVIKVGKTTNINQRLKQHDSYAFFGLDKIKIYKSGNINEDENKIIYEANKLSKQLKPESFLFSQSNLDKLLDIMDLYYE